MGYSGFITKRRLYGIPATRLWCLGTYELDYNPIYLYFRNHKPLVVALQLQKYAMKLLGEQEGYNTFPTSSIRAD